MFDTLRAAKERWVPARAEIMADGAKGKVGGNVVYKYNNKMYVVRFFPRSSSCGTVTRWYVSVDYCLDIKK